MISFLKKYVNKFRYAFGGLFHGITHDRSIFLQCLIGLTVIIIFAFFHLTMVEWALVLILIGSIIALEFINLSLIHI